MSNAVPTAESDAVRTYGVCGRHFPTVRPSLALSYHRHAREIPRPLTYFGPKVRAHDKVFALEEPPCKEGQSDRTPVVNGEFPRHSLDQLSEQRQEGSLDGERRGPHDAEQRIDRRQRTE